MKLLTVILLTYNHEKTLARAFDSILEQETNFDFDIFVLEDCSTDRTAEVCREYKAKYPEKIHLFLNEKILGPAHNYKQGLLKVQSKYHAFLEGDDYWCDKRKLQSQVDALEQNSQYTMCGHDTLVQDTINQEECTFSASFGPIKKTSYNVKERFRVHPSSRLYRNVIDFSAIPHYMVFDTRIYLLYLLHGDLYYIDRIMSVYNITGTGFWSGRSKAQQKILALKLNYQMNQFLSRYITQSSYPKLARSRTFQKFVKNRLLWSMSYYLKMVRLHFKRIVELIYNRVHSDFEKK